MEDLVCEQRNLMGRISRSFTNFKKDGSAKMTISNCKTRMLNLEKLWSKFESNHFELLHYKEDDTENLDYFKNNDFDITEELYLDRRCEFQAFIDSTSDVKYVDPLPKLHLHTEESERLPMISLPKFSGNFNEWESFRDLFSTLVANKTNISNVTKLHHLKTSLGGDASRLISSYAITEENFLIAWNKLQEKYENKRRLINSHMDSIFSMKNMKKESSYEIKRIISGINTPLAALKLLKRPIEQWDDFLVYHLVSLLDSETRRQWEKHLGNTSNPMNPPSFEFLLKFLENQSSMLESLEDTRNNFKENKSNHSQSLKTHHTESTINNKCLLCNSSHFFLFCDIYKNQTPLQRKEFIQNQKRCFNCLAKHSSKNCFSKKRCQICRGKHHTSLHIINSEISNLTPSSSFNNAPSPNFSSNSCKTTNHVLLATAFVKICSSTGSNYSFARALIDQGSQASFISESLCQRLNIKCKPVDLPISGVGGKINFTCRKLAQFSLRNRFETHFSLAVEAYVIPKITTYMPPLNNDICKFPYLNYLELADPQFLQGGQIELLLGSAIHSRIVEGEIVRGKDNEPIATKTALGWIVSGDTPFSHIISLPYVLHSNEMPLDELFHRFFIQEEFMEKEKLLSPEETKCENHFRNTFSRDSTGRYTVRLPFNTDNYATLDFPDIYSIAKNMLLRMERKFEANVNFNDMYKQFMKDYVESGHMIQVSDENITNIRYFLPHHGVLRETSQTTKLRAVFNGSAKASNKKSINDYLQPGLNLLPDLSEIILRWRKYAYVFVSDIKQMFRQIRVHPDDQIYQAILWRFSSNEPIGIWQLQTVTYGLVSSPFLAIRVTRQLADDECHKFPLGAQILRTETYMDDTPSGGHSLEEAILKRDELIELCKVGGFKLHKWLANDKRLLEGLIDETQIEVKNLEYSDVSVSSILGLSWNSNSDYFLFNINIDITKFENIKLTKRLILSEVAKLFDPLGWLSPVIITAKIFMQQLWINRIDWDVELNSELTKQWLDWYKNLLSLKSIKINRWLRYQPDASLYELHGFADASKFAYGAVVYLRIVEGNEVFVNLIQAKTKVAPIKPLLTIPRLELCAATLLAKLAQKVMTAIEIENCNLYLWSDSTDVLYWLKDHPSRWPVFIANRCSKIHSMVPQACWGHVRSNFNPADCISRGIHPSDLKDFELWWKGPEWLRDNTRCFENLNCNNIANSVCNSNLTSNTPKDEDPQTWELLTKYSSMLKLTRVTAYILRFITALIKRTNIQKFENSKLFCSDWFKHCNYNAPLELNSNELKRACLSLVYIVQRLEYNSEIKMLSKNRTISRTSNLLKLDPIIHENLLRVGGRLHNSLLDFDQIHPLILPYESNLSLLLVKWYHCKTLHGGIKLTLSTIRREYWIINGRALVKKVINLCHPCLRYRGSTIYQKLGNLPGYRIRPSRPFLNSGVDYAGPYNIRAFSGRGQKTYKGYIAVFICLSTRAVHLELVSGYSSGDFIAAFRRFTSRRGLCADLYSDRGTTFIGADRELRELFQKSSLFIKQINNTLAGHGTNWHFNPPAAPHFGGIWEAAVKSTKHHLKRVIGSKTLTFEEFSTLLTQVESCLNSRPLLPITDDVTDGQPLTPAHFLIQSPSFIVPEPDYSNDKISPSQRWKHIQQMLQHWWNQWSKDYLQTLYVRNKWQTTQPQLIVGDIVLIKDENYPPAKWPLAKVIKVYFGSDNLVRVVKLRTATTELERPVTKLILLNKFVEPEDAEKG